MKPQTYNMESKQIKALKAIAKIEDVTIAKIVRVAVARYTEMYFANHGKQMQEGGSRQQR